MKELLNELAKGAGLTNWQAQFIAGCRKYWKKNGYLTDKQMGIIIEIRNETGKQGTEKATAQD